MTENDIREQLKSYAGRRVGVEGTISRISTLWDYDSKCEIPSVCLKHVEIREGDHPHIDHVWVSFASLLVDKKVRIGDTVRVSAQVYQYQHRDKDDINKVTSRWGLRQPRDIQCLNRSLESDPVIIKPEAVPVIRHTPPPPPQPEDPKRKLLNSIWALVNEYGIVKVEKTLVAVKALTEDAD